MAAARSSRPSYSARPQMTPAMPRSPAALSASRSARSATPPEAITGIEMARARAAVAATLTPSKAPSRSTSVKTMAATPQSSKRRARSTTAKSTVSAQPSTATRPPRASMPTTMRPGKARQAPRTRSGSRSAAVPRMTRATPAANQVSIAAMSRMPPPNCRGMSIAAKIAVTASWLTLAPAKAPSRSTTCSQAQPARAKATA